jgi:hypothetical protein
MGKRRPSIPAGQFAFTFDVPSRAIGAAALAGLDREIAATVALMLKEDPRPSRFPIAAAMSELLDEEVTKAMLDKYASESSEAHAISFARMLALTQVTERYDLLNRLTRRIGAALLVGPEILTAEIGQIDRQMVELRERRRVLAGAAPVISSGRIKA